MYTRMGNQSSWLDLVREHELVLLETLSKPVDPERLFRAMRNVIPAAERHRNDVVTTGIEFFTAGYQGDQLTAAAVRKGLEQGYAKIAVQPKVRLHDNRVVGAEALLRWTDPVRGPIPPTAVVPTAEKHGLIDNLSLIVFRQAVAALADWRQQGHDMTVSVNLSERNLTDLHLPERLAEIAHTAGVETGCIILEITESDVVDSSTASRLEVIGRLRLKGFGMSIDDFGIGFSSMKKLGSIPFTELKIDREFVHGVTGVHDSAARVILGCSVELGHALQLSVVAEGVEDEEERRLVAALGCDEIQGYLVARPMPPDEFLAWKIGWDATPRVQRDDRPSAPFAWRR